MTAADRKRQRDVLTFWRESAHQDLKIAEDNFELGHYHWALFLCHLAIEKLLKAHIVRAEQTPPFIHELDELARRASLVLPARFTPWLEEISEFHIAGRYDNDKRTFYRKATKAYATTWFAHCREIFVWLDDQLTS